MEYRGSWRNTSGWGVICAMLAAMTFAAGILNPVMLIVPAAILTYLWLIGRRLRVWIDDEKLIYRGWLASHEARWNDIHSITNEFPYPKNHWRFPLSYEVRTADDVFVINMLYFPPEFFRKFHDKATRLGHLHPNDDDPPPRDAP